MVEDIFSEMIDELFSAESESPTKRYNSVLTQEVSESWIVEVMNEDDFSSPRPPTAPAVPPLMRLSRG